MIFLHIADFNGGRWVERSKLQLQRALHSPSRGIKVLSSETVFFFKNVYSFYHKCLFCPSSATRVHGFRHYVITLERSHMM